MAFGIFFEINIKTHIFHDVYMENRFIHEGKERGGVLVLVKTCFRTTS